MADEWFWCQSCDIEFQDPYAPEDDFGIIYGNCPECCRTIERPTQEEFERRQALPVHDYRGGQEEGVVNVEQSMRRWTGWTLLGYAALWAGYHVAPGPSVPVENTVAGIASFLLFVAVYFFLIYYGFEYLADTGGLLRLDDEPTRGEAS